MHLNLNASFRGALFWFWNQVKALFPIQELITVLRLIPRSERSSIPRSIALWSPFSKVAVSQLKCCLKDLFRIYRSKNDKDHRMFGIKSELPKVWPRTYHQIEKIPAGQVLVRLAIGSMRIKLSSSGRVFEVNEFEPLSRRFLVWTNGNDVKR